MQNVIAGQVAVAATPTPNPLVSAHRRNLLDLLAEATQTITTAEYDRAVSNILACESLPTLQRWYVNLIREIARREEAAGTTPALANMAAGIARFEQKLAKVEEATPTAPATQAQKEEIITLANSVYVLRKEKTAAHLTLPQLTEVGAVALIGELWAKILHRQERYAEGMAEASQSFSAAC